MLGLVVAGLRQAGGRAMRNAVAGDQELTTEELASADDPGLFGPDSVAWRVHGDSSMLIGGLRALLLQTLHPLAMAGVAEHSDYVADPWGRLHRTGRFIAATTYGSTASAERSIAMVRVIHDRVVGIAPDGRPYAASDPHLLGWVHVTEVDSFLRAFDRYGTGALTDAERDGYVEEMAEIGTRLGATDLPRTRAELAEALRAYRAECRAGSQAFETVRFLMVPPSIPFVLRGAYGVIAAGAIGLLPPWARSMLWLPLPPLVDPVAIRPAATVLTRTIGWLMADRPRPGELHDLASAPTG